MWIFSRNVEDRYMGYTAVLGVHLFLLFFHFFGEILVGECFLSSLFPFNLPNFISKGYTPSSRSSARSVIKCKKFGNCFLEY